VCEAHVHLVLRVQRRGRPRSDGLRRLEDFRYFDGVAASRLHDSVRARDRGSSGLRRRSHDLGDASVRSAADDDAGDDHRSDLRGHAARNE
jgi:hypothetical protein